MLRAVLFLPLLLVPSTADAAAATTTFTGDLAILDCRVATPVFPIAAFASEYE